MKLKNKPTSDQLREARKGGFKRKRPSKPKAGANYNTLANWAGKYNDWVALVHKAVTIGKAKEKLRMEIRSI